MKNLPIINLVSEREEDLFFSDFHGFIGQESAIKQLDFFIKSHSSVTPFPTLLLSGSHGLGKTYLAQKTANSMKRDFLMFNCGDIKKSDDFISKVLLPISHYGNPTTIFMDESHNMSNDVTTLLLTLLNPTSAMTNTVSYYNSEILYDMRKINMIFATTDAHQMFSPLRNRCTPIYFSPYNKEDVIKILKYYLDDITLNCDNEKVANACRSRARDSYVLSQHIRRYCSLNNISEFTDKHWEELRNIFDIRPCGLRREEVSLLKVISEYGPISCANIALRLMVNEDNVKSELEIRLRELGMINSTTKGRVLTEDGENYIKEHCNA